MKTIKVMILLLFGGLFLIAAGIMIGYDVVPKNFASETIARYYNPVSFFIWENFAILVMLGYSIISFVTFYSMHQSRRR